MQVCYSRMWWGIHWRNCWNFLERFKEYLKTLFPIYYHFNTPGHLTIVYNLSIVDREDQSLTKAIKEAIYWRVNGPSFNRNGGKYHLPHIWDSVLFTTLELKLNRLILNNFNHSTSCGAILPNDEGYDFCTGCGWTWHGISPLVGF